MSPSPQTTASAAGVPPQPQASLVDVAAHGQALGPLQGKTWLAKIDRRSSETLKAGQQYRCAQTARWGATLPATWMTRRKSWSSWRRTAARSRTS